MIIAKTDDSLGISLFKFFTAILGIWLIFILKWMNHTPNMDYELITFHQFIVRDNIQ